jgi:hypothetical protein
LRPDLELSQRFVRLVWDAVNDPGSADRGELLRVASDFLDSIGMAPGPLPASARALAHAALNWSMTGGTPQRLEHAARVFALRGALHRGEKMIAQLTD